MFGFGHRSIDKIRKKLPEDCLKLLDQIDEGACLIRSGRIVHCNTRFLNLSGYQSHHIEGTEISDLLTPSAAPAQHMLHNAAGSLKNKDGGEVPVTLRWNSLNINGTDLDICYLRVRPEHTTEQDQIIQMEKRYRTLFDLSPSGILLEGLDGTILDVNPAFCRSLGYDRSELIGRRVHHLAPDDRQEEVERDLSRLARGETLRHHARSLRRDGTTREMNLNETKIVLPDGREGILCIAEDITEQIIEAENRLMNERKQSIMEMAGAICHELNQPMTVISVNCDLLLMHEFSPEDTAEKIEVIKKQLSQMTRITKKLMTITSYKTREYLSGTTIIDIDRSSGRND